LAITTGLKKVTLFFTSLLILVCGLCFAGEDWVPQIIGPFLGLNNRDNSFVIGSQNAQDLLNVNVTPGGKSVFKRKGYGIAFTLPITTSAVHGVYTFFDASANTVDLFANDTYLSGSVSGASPTTIFSNGPNGATYQCTDTLGFAYCANSSRTTIIKTNGVTSSQISNVASTGTMVATCVTRLAMAGFSDRPSGIDFSADSDFTTWGTGSLGSSAVQLTVSAPGARITGIVYAFGRLMWFKDSSFGFVLIGNQPLQTDWVIKTVSYDVGTNDNSFVFREGILYFRGQDGHIYAFDGASYQRASREIAGTIATEQNRSQGSWLQTTQSDWASGYDITSVYIDTNTSPGNVQMTFPDNFSSFRSTGSTKNVWTSYCKGLTPCTTNVYSNSSSLVFLSTTGTAGEDQMIRTVSPLNNYKQGTTFYIQLSTISTASNTVFSFGISSYSANIPITSSLFNDQFFFDFKSTQSSTIFLNRVKNTADGTICNGTCQTGNSISTGAISIYIATTAYQVSIDGVVIKSGSHSHSNNSYYAYFDSFWGNVGSGSTSLDSFGIAPETATYYSAVKNAPSLRTWDSFVANTQSNGGTQNFFIRSSTNSINVNSSTPSWTSITSGNVPTISTGTYFQTRDDFAITVATQQPALNDFTQNWVEGSAVDKAYATYFDDKIWWEVTAGTGATTNNKTLIYDMLNQTWSLYDLAVNGFYVRQNRLYFGSSSGGYIYKFGDVDNDNGSAINAYWKSKDFYGGSPFGTQEIANISFSNKTVSNSSMTVTYTLNGSSSTSFTIPTSNSVNSFYGRNKNLPAGTVGSTYNIQFGNNAADQPFEVFSIQVGIRPKSWIPTP
jgi:hypothetical protein